MTTTESLRAALTAVLPATLLTLATAACGTDPTEPGPGPDPGDTTAPKVVATTPTASATGIGAGEKIEITFSEPMDRATIEAAYSSQKLPLDKVSMSWNADGTVLTISPDQPLAYAEGAGLDPSAVTPISYTIAIGADAADVSGNGLEAPLALTFATKRRLTGTVGLDAALSRSTLGGTTLGESVNIMAGDSVLGNAPYRGYVSFDLTAVPDGVTVEAASFSARQLPIEGIPYGTFGALNAYHMTFSAMTDIGSVAPMATVGAFSQDGNVESKSIDVTTQVIDDLANRDARSDRSQYRLQFDVPTDSDNAYDRTTFDRNTFALSLTFVAD